MTGLLMSGDSKMIVTVNVAKLEGASFLEKEDNILQKYVQIFKNSIKNELKGGKT